MEILPLDSRLEDIFWNHVYQDVPHHHFFILDWKFEKNSTKILLALKERRLCGDERTYSPQLPLFFYFNNLLSVVISPRSPAISLFLLILFSSTSVSNVENVCAEAFKITRAKDCSSVNFNSHFLRQGSWGNTRF